MVKGTLQQSVPNFSVISEEFFKIFFSVTVFFLSSKRGIPPKIQRKIVISEILATSIKN